MPAIRLDEAEGVDGLHVGGEGRLNAAGSSSWTFTVVNETESPMSFISSESRFETADGSILYFRSLSDSLPADEEVPLAPKQTRTYHLTTSSTSPDGSRVTLVFSDGTTKREWVGSQRGGPPASNRVGGYPAPGYSTGGCTKGCRCGNSCIDCSKTCHAGQTYRRRRMTP